MLTIEIEREEDGRWIGEVPELPGVVAYGATEDEARNRAAALALRVIADRIEQGEPAPIGAGDFVCRSVSTWPSTKANRVLRALHRVG
jgi:predicted RNase H-like HicB family nuclease